MSKDQKNNNRKKSAEEKKQEAIFYCYDIIFNSKNGKRKPTQKLAD